jgi:hypothetical protein
VAYPEFVSLTVEDGRMVSVSITQHTNPVQVLSRHHRGGELPVLCHLGLPPDPLRSLAAEWEILCQRDRLRVPAVPEPKHTAGVQVNDVACGTVKVATGRWAMGWEVRGV